MMDFSQLLCIEDSVSVFINSLEDNQPIVCFGAGFALRNVLLQLEKYNLNVVCVCDNDPIKQGTIFDERYPIYSLDSVLNKYSNAVYVITTQSYFWEVKKYLEGFIPTDRICTVDFNVLHYFDGTKFKKLLSENVDRFNLIANNLADDLSKQILFNVVKAHCSKKREDFESASIGMGDWYLFDSLLKPRRDDIFLDCGAYDGDTLLLFNKAATDGYGSIIAFEPDESLYDSLIRNLEYQAIHNVVPVNKGVSDFDGKIGFNKQGMYSSITGSNSGCAVESKLDWIDVVKIDSFLNGGRVDIIKMDIEGGELNALKGASESIKMYKPKMAICLYHNAEDFLDIPEYILKLSSNYNLYIRHHSDGCTDTILYAIHS